MIFCSQVLEDMMPPLPIHVVDAFLDKDSFKVLYTTCSIWNIRKFIEKKTIYLKQPLHAYGFICKEGYLNRLFSVNFRYLKWNFVCIWLKRNFHHKVNHPKGLNREKEGVGFVLSSNICEFTCFKNAYVEPKSIVSNLFLIMVITHHEVYLK